MRIVAIMPTYRRLHLVENALACFLAQTHQDKHLLIADESLELQPCDGANWDAKNVSPWNSLAQKQNWMAGCAFRVLKADAIVLMQDDDVYLPHHLEAHAAALAAKPDAWSSSSQILVDGSGGGPVKDIYPEQHPRGCHGSLGMTRQAFEKMNGWPPTPTLAMDLIMMGNLRATLGPFQDTIAHGPPSFYFRWVSTGLPHGESFGGTNPESWAKRYRQALDEKLGPIQPRTIQPRMDAETEAIYSRLNSK